MPLEELAHKFTIIGTIIAIFLFGIAIIEVIHFNELVGQTERSTTSLTTLINKTDNLLTEMQKSTTSLATLVDKTDQLIQTQNSTSSNISQQTILKEYGDEAPFHMSITYCNYEVNDNGLAYSPTILDKNGNATPLKFMLIRFFGYYTLPTDNGISYLGSKGVLEDDTTPELIDPSGGGDQLYNLSLVQALNQTKKSNDAYLFIHSEYYFAPYSEITGKLLTKYTYDGVGQQMIEFKKDNQGNWQLYPSKNSVCK
ncbi:MAG: hypothetical protein KGI28_02980 [Thaumarchaeota archaeon]|nr:hypothetical protein [Nitrososphaerota archaeon]